jgi:hypothetical protein
MATVVIPAAESLRLCIGRPEATVVIPAAESLRLGNVRPEA